ncbi:MAG: ABC transporter permease [Caldilineaceae bacterium]|nr:ABC transporter permease [Caldilineaceae bacterium]
MSTPSFAQPSWQAQLRAVNAIAWKNWLHFIRYPLNALFGVLQPLIWLTPLYFLGESFRTAEGSVGFAAYTGTNDYMSFVLVGSLLSSYISSVFWGMGFALKREMDSGVLESNWLTPVPRFAFLIGQTITNLVTTTIVNLGILTISWWLFGFSVSGNFWGALSVILPMLLALYGFGFAFAAVVLLMRDANMLVDVSDYLVTIFSGSQFPVQALPTFLLPVALALPLTYGFDAARGLLLHTNTLLPIPYAIAVLFLFMAVTVPTGYAIFRHIERRVKRLGTLGMH